MKALSKDNLLSIRYWQELKHLYNYLKAFYKTTIIVEGKYMGLADYFQTLNWLLLELKKTQQKFTKLAI